jgi:hypothetical protein
MTGRKKMAVKEGFMGSRVKMIAVLYKSFFGGDQIIKVLRANFGKKKFFSSVISIRKEFDFGSNMNQKSPNK